MDRNLERAVGMTPDDVLDKSKNPSAFIYTPEYGLWVGETRELHGHILINKYPEVKKLLTARDPSLITKGIDPEDVHELMGKVSLIGRVGDCKKARLFDSSVVSFWYDGIRFDLLRPCLQALVKQSLAQEDTIVVLPGSANYLGSILNGRKSYAQSNNPSSNDALKMHLLRGAEKKQALLAVGAKPKKPSPWNLSPGTKYWSMYGDHVNFKNWLTLNS